MDVVKLKVSQLIVDPKNARVHDEENIEAIKSSLKEFSQYKPIIVQQSTMKIIAGNGTYFAAKELGWKEIDCHVLDITDEKATALGIADNRTGDLSKFDNDILSALLKAMDDDLKDVIGFAATEIEQLVDSKDEVFKEKAKIPKADALLPALEYVVIVCSPGNIEWEELKEALELQEVSRGGLELDSNDKDSTGIQRVVKASDLLERLRNANSSSK